MKEITDLKLYLDHIDKLSKPLSKEQRSRLRIVISTITTLLVGFVKGTRLGKVDIIYKR